MMIDEEVLAKLIHCCVNGESQKKYLQTSALLWTWRIAEEVLAN
jgi:hypothetical protein